MHGEHLVPVPIPALAALLARREKQKGVLLTEAGVLDCFWPYAVEDYSGPLSLKTTVHPRNNGNRPCLDIERDGHLLAEHLWEGISIQQAQEIAERALHDSQDTKHRDSQTR